MAEEIYPCFNKHQRDFLVTVTIHKARNLNVLNADTFVTVVFNGESRKTKVFQNSDCPFYNEVSKSKSLNRIEIALSNSSILCLKCAQT